MIRGLVAGILAADPEFRTTPDGVPVTTRRMVVLDADRNDTPCLLAATGELAEPLGLFRAGQAVAVFGEARLFVATDKAGNQIAGLTLTVDELRTLETAQRAQDAGAAP